jgi:glycosyltransferase involved in cell wall biosynthesis
MNNQVIKKKRIGIDARFYGPLGKGLGRYVQELVDNLIEINEENDGEFEYVIFLSPENFDEFHSTSNFVKKKLISLPWYSWREQLFFPSLIKKEGLDLMHFPHFNVPIFSSTPFVVTIHDLILTRFPSRRASMLPAALYWLKQLAYRLVISMAMKKARQVIAVSQFTKQDIVNKFKVDSKKVIVIYEGVANLSKGQAEDFIEKRQALILDKYQIKSPFLLYVGNAYPHKNLEFLLKSFKELLINYPNLSLVMVGKEDYFYRRLKKQAQELGIYRAGDNQSKLIFTAYVPDEELAVLYKEALVYVFPSLYEGFGLPPLEAMSFSCPVLSSDQASLPEVLAEAALYFNPYQQADLLKQLELIIRDNSLRLKLKAEGAQNIRRFNWKKCSQETLGIYRASLSS